MVEEIGLGKYLQYTSHTYAVYPLTSFYRSTRQNNLPFSLILLYQMEYIYYLLEYILLIPINCGEFPKQKLFDCKLYDFIYGPYTC